MAYSVDWLSEAVADVESIASFIADDSAAYASAVVHYRVIYHVEAMSVLVLAVIHGARLLPDFIRDRSN